MPIYIIKGVTKSPSTLLVVYATLLSYLETVSVGHKTVSDFFRFPKNKI